MDLDAWIKKSVSVLKKSGIDIPKLEVEVLLADILNKDRSWIIANPEHLLTKNQLVILDAQIDKRAEHVPIAYIRGIQEFYKRNFHVTPDTLTPRPETETMINMLLKTIKSGQIAKDITSVMDVGTGSGCIIVTALLELKSIINTDSTIFYGIDHSEEALYVARENADLLGANVAYRLLDITKDSITSIFKPQQNSVVLANLPYVPDDFKINLAASHEPPESIYGGSDGLDYYRKMFRQLEPSPKPCSVFTEALPPQHKELQKLAKSHGFVLQNTEDFIQYFSNIK